MSGTVSTDELKRKIHRRAGNFYLVETLAPERYREGHLPGAINIPPERIQQLAPSLLPDKSAEIVTYCANLH